MKKTRHTIEILLYLIIGVSLIFFLIPTLTWFRGFMYREDGQKAMDFAGTFAAETADADALFLGSSHVYTQVIPMMIWENFGIPVYDLRSSNQTIAISYYYLVEALKTQQPSVVFLDLYTLDSIYNGLGEAQNSNQNVAAGMPWSKNKVELIMNAMPPEQRFSLFFDVYAFHNRWKALEKDDFSYFTGRLRGSVERDYMKGGMFMFAWEKREDRFFSDAPAVPIADEVYQFNYEYIRSIASLCAEKNIQLILLMTLTGQTSDASYRLNRVQNDLAADGYSLMTLNLDDFRNEMGIDAEVDMWDSVHTTYEGAQKVSSFLGKYLSEELNLPDRHSDKAWRTWNRDLTKYIDYRDRRLEQFR